MGGKKGPQQLTQDHVSGQANKPLSQPPHALDTATFVQEIGANGKDGLNKDEAKRRLEEYGENDLGNSGGVNAGKILVRQFANAMTLVLILAMAVSFGIQSYIEGGVIAGVIGINLVVGFYNEYNAAKTMDSLRSLSSPTASTVRDGNDAVIPTREVVPGDMIMLKSGDTVPADIRLIEAVNFQTDEALLTGESLPVEKQANEVFDAETGPGDRLNVAYSSSTVTNGRAKGIVFATGMFTEIGTIAAALRHKDSKVREVKRKPDGSAGPHRYLEAIGLTVTDSVGAFLGVNVGTPLQKKLSRLAVLLFGVACICAVIVLAANNFADYPDVAGSDPQQEIAIYAVATGLSMIPACLTVVLTITMAAGTKRMVERNVIVRRMEALEALGGVTDICSDKTGTLTQGKMIVKKAWIPAKGTYSIGETSEALNPTVGDISFTSKTPSQTHHSASTDEKEQTFSADQLLKDNETLVDYLKVASLANLAEVHETEGTWKGRGDPTEIAIQVFASRFNYYRKLLTEDTDKPWKQVAEFPFNSDIKKMSVIFTDPETSKNWVFTKGAVERIVDSCTKVQLEDGGEIVDLTSEFKDKISYNMEAITSLGLRCLALASRVYEEPLKEGDANPEREKVETNLVFRGLIGLYDPPRPESKDAVAKCQRAGIQVHMLTGDHPGTASAIARQVGILPQDTSAFSKRVADAMVMTAAQFDKYSDDQLDTLPVLPLVVARCAPNTKVRMIEALHRRGRYVAMTGDGVNDSPSLKRADVGIAMGESGSDVAKDASDIILTDDNFASILNAVEEGRRMFDNIQKFILHLLAENIAQACVLLIGLAFKDSRDLSVFPLSPVEILWVIMITSGFPDMGLGFEVAAPDVMDRPPVSLKKGIFSWEIIVDMFAYGLWIAALVLGAFSLVIWGFGEGRLGDSCNNGYSQDCDPVFRARGTAFATLTWVACFLAWELVDMRRSFFRMQPDSTRYFTQWMSDIWRNKFLFWAIMAGFILMFPVLYIPVINHDVFVHTGISWEWGIVFVATAIFFAGVETWKYGKRVFFRHHERKQLEKNGKSPSDDIEKRAFGSFIKRIESDPVE